MTAPRRIQLSRVKGWRKPEDAIVVARPSRWGNPYPIRPRPYRLHTALALFENTARGVWNPSLLATWNDDDVHEAYVAHHAWLTRLGWHPIDLARSQLAGHDLCCWCGPDAPCHADVLLAIANEALR